MKKLLYPIAFALTVFLILYSCSAEEEDTTPPPQVQQPTPEPETPAPTQYTLEVTAGEGGTVSTEGGTYDEGTEVTITATPEEGYEFIGWEGNESNSDTLTINISTNISLEAIFEPSCDLSDTSNLFTYSFQEFIEEFSIGDKISFGNKLLVFSASSDGLDGQNGNSWSLWMENNYGVNRDVKYIKLSFDTQLEQEGLIAELFYDSITNIFLFIRFRDITSENAPNSCAENFHFFQKIYYEGALIQPSFEDNCQAVYFDCIIETFVSAIEYSNGIISSQEISSGENNTTSSIYSYNNVELDSPPFDGTIYITGDIITSADPSYFNGITYSGLESRQMYDRRNGGAWINIQPHIFDATFSDGLTIEIQINSEFTLEEATAEAEKYGFLVGQLSKALRKDVETMWIHKGTEAYGGGNNNILIHTGETDFYENYGSGIVEETLIHEAAHTSIDAYHYPERETNGQNWIQAVDRDGCYISNYARDYPYREDIAELMPLYIAVRYFPDRISSELRDQILSCNINRIEYLDSLNLNMSIYED